MISLAYTEEQQIEELLSQMEEEIYEDLDSLLASIREESWYRVPLIKVAQ